MSSTPPFYYVPGSGTATGPQAQDAVGTAHTYVLIGLIFYVLSVIGSGVAWVFLLFFLARAAVFAFAIFFPAFFGIIALVQIGFTIWAWMTLRSIEEGRYAEARSAALVLGIMGLFIAGVIAGVFFLLAHSKLGELTIPAPTYGSRFCVKCGKPVLHDAKFCPNCGSRLP